MRAVAAFPGSEVPRLVEVAEPAEPAPGQVLARTLQLGICGTDREILDSRGPLVPPNEDYLILGHECLARIEAVGSGVTGLEAGQLVVPVVRRTLGTVDRRVDFLPFGSYVERGIVWQHGFSTPWWVDEAQHLYLVEPELARWAILTEPLAVAEKGCNEAVAVQRGRLGPEIWQATAGHPAPQVLVTGLGPIAFTSLLACRVRGWPTTVLGRDPHHTFRAQLVERLGARYLTVEGASTIAANVESQGFDLVLECTGSDEVLVRSATWMRSQAVMIWQGSSRQATPKAHNLAQMVRDGLLRNQVFVGCVNAAPRDFRDALEHLGQLGRQCPGELEALVTRQVKPEDSLPHYQQRESQGIKTVLVYE